MSQEDYMNSFNYQRPEEVDPNKPPLPTKVEYTFTAKNVDMLNAMAAFARDKFPDVNFTLSGLNFIVYTPHDYNTLLEPFYNVLMS